jgi:hypothetical protein
MTARGEAMTRQVKSVAAKTRAAVKRAPGEARKVMANVKDKASTMGEKAGNAIGTATMAAATVAGVVVGTVQSAMGTNPQAEGGSSGSGGESDRD